MFKKVACLTDIHFGLKSNSQQHNQDCEDFVDWFIETAKEKGCETGIFLGDWSHNRNSINIITLDYSLRCLEKLGKAFNQFYFITGNHDLYYKDKRDIHSAAFGRHIPGITIVDKPLTIDDVTIYPWLVGNEWRNVERNDSRYIFGHFELPNFFMNAMVQMPDHGEIHDGHFHNNEYLFTGHFHKRQQRKNIVYIGNCFPHNYSDAWDNDRGMMILDYGSSPEYHRWPGAPEFKTLKLSELLDKPDQICTTKSYLRVTIDIDISYEEAQYIKERFMNDYSVRELTLIPEKKEIEVNSDINISLFESVDQIVSSQIVAIDSTNYDKNLLLSIYNNL